MYRISQLMSTPVARSSEPEREHAAEPSSSTCVCPSLACDFLDGDSPLDCCSIDPLTGSHFPCRRSPRLLTNGYYVWTEDSFLCDKDGNITLSPAQTSVIYKENLVRIFRKKKRIRHPFSSLFKLAASKSCLHGSILGDVDSSSSEDIWLEEASRPDIHHRSENGADLDCSPADWEPETPSAKCAHTSAPGHVASQPPGKNSHEPPLQSQSMASDHLQGDAARLSKTSLLGEVSLRTVLLAACLLISAYARWFLGGILAGVFTCCLAVTIAYVVKSLFLSLASYFKATTCVRFARFDSHSGAPLMNAFGLDIRKLSDLQSAWNSCFIGRK